MPKKFTNRNREMVVTNAEIPIIVNSDSSKFVLEINPGSAIAFPWLSSIANSFETYEVKDLWFSYVNSVPLSQNGSVHMAFDYDVKDTLDITYMDANYIATMYGSVSSYIGKSVTMKYSPS